MWFAGQAVFVAADMYYSAPPKQALVETSGQIAFQERSSSVSLVLQKEDGTSIRLSCNPPTKNLSCGVFQGPHPFVVRDYTSHMKGKNATAWWYADPDVNGDGRIYQLSIGDTEYLNYQQQVSLYSSYSRDVPLDVAIFVLSFCMTIIAIWKLAKSSKKVDFYPVFTVDYRENPQKVVTVRGANAALNLVVALLGCIVAIICSLLFATAGLILGGVWEMVLLSAMAGCIFFGMHFVRCYLRARSESVTIKPSQGSVFVSNCDRSVEYSIGDFEKITVESAFFANAGHMIWAELKGSKGSCPIGMRAVSESELRKKLGEISRFLNLEIVRS